jgi:hypothetical protein
MTTNRYVYLRRLTQVSSAPSVICQNTRVGGFHGYTSGRNLRRGRLRPIKTPGSRACAYKSTSGLGEWPNRDPIGEEGFELLIWPSNDSGDEDAGPNVYDFVANDPVDSLDDLGLWKWWTHRDLVEKAFNDLQLPSDMTANVRSEILNTLIEINIGVDSGPTKNQLQWHFNRPIDPKGEHIDEYKGKYLDNLANRAQDIDYDIKNPSKDRCKDALKIIGQLSHAWQDYYAHAVNINYHGERDFTKIGYISGDPEHPGADIKPCSWGGTFHPGEHHWVEPGMRAPDRDARLQDSKEYTQSGYQEFFGKWWPVCKCLYK